MLQKLKLDKQINAVTKYLKINEHKSKRARLFIKTLYIRQAINLPIYAGREILEPGGERVKKTKEQRKWEKKNLPLYERYPNFPLYVSIIALLVSIIMPIVRKIFNY